MRSFALLLVSGIGFPTCLSAATWIVDPAGGGDALTIQGAVDLAAPGDEILIRSGTYQEQVTLDFSLTIRGDSATPELTVIDAEGIRPFCLLATSFSSTTVLQSLTFTGVVADGIPPCGEAALRIFGALEMDNCAVVENVAPLAPAFLNGPAEISNSLFKNNEGTGFDCDGIDPDFASGCIHCLLDITVDGCLFEMNTGYRVGVLSTDSQATIKNCQIRENNGEVIRSPLGVTLENSLVADNVGHLFYTEDLVVILQGNTFANNPELIRAPGIMNILSGSVIYANVFAMNDAGIGVPNGGNGMTITCNDSWGNGINYTGFDPLPGGNFSANPMFCGAQTGNYFVDVQSPLLPQNNSCNELIGALGEGCDAVSADPGSELRTWGQIKNAYR